MVQELLEKSVFTNHPLVLAGRLIHVQVAHLFVVLVVVSFEGHSAALEPQLPAVVPSRRFFDVGLPLQVVPA